MAGESARSRKPAGVILAGGRSRRMGGINKAFLELDGRPLLQHVIDRVRPQTESLYLSVESHEPAFGRFGLELLPDPVPGHAGPLGGLLAALRRLQDDELAEWLLLVPCDAPFVPPDLGQRLLEQAGTEGSDGAVVITGDELQPAFSLWNRSVTPELEQAVIGDGMAGFKQFLRRHGLAELCWEGNDPNTGAPPFFNINDRDMLERAQRYFPDRAENKPCRV